jgi:hypothetical protein
VIQSAAAAAFHSPPQLAGEKAHGPRDHDGLAVLSTGSGIADSKALREQRISTEEISILRRLAKGQGPCAAGVEHVQRSLELKEFDGCRMTRSSCESSISCN